MKDRILITGGAGFVGSHLALSFRRDYPSAEIVVLDNLKRRGSETNLSVLKSNRIEFIHGDIRVPTDLTSIKGSFDTLIESSAEPSVLGGLNSPAQYVVESNLVGTVNCLEFARQRHVPKFIFLSTSRTYSTRPLQEIKLNETPTRFEIAKDQSIPGVSQSGIAESFPTHLPSSLYGATKLASELMVREYAHLYGLKTIVNRCSVLGGPGQFGKVDQGVLSLWIANHYYGLPLQYTGYGGNGKQVRDILHPSDLYQLLKRQLDKAEDCQDRVFNIGGGTDNAVSLRELTHICEEVVEKRTSLTSNPDTHKVDIPCFISDTSAAKRIFQWSPTRSVKSIVQETFEWFKENDMNIRQVFAA